MSFIACAHGVGAVICEAKLKDLSSACCGNNPQPTPEQQALLHCPGMCLGSCALGSTLHQFTERISLLWRTFVGVQGCCRYSALTTQPLRPEGALCGGQVFEEALQRGFTHNTRLWMALMEQCARAGQVLAF